MRRSLRVLGLLVAIGSLTSCFGEDYGTPGMMIWNQTDAPIDVIYRRDIGGVVTDDEVAHIGANQGILVIGPHQMEGPCLRGSLIALQDGREIATVAQPCEGTDWMIGGQR